jgi:rubrerythrin
MVISNKELLGISTRIERDGRLFYMELSKHVDDPIVKEFLLVMAKEEALHEIQFKEMLEEKGDQIYGWEDNQGLRDMVDKEFKTDIFPAIEEIMEQATKIKGIEKALDFAVEAETVAGEFYGLLVDMCNNIEVKTLLVLLEKAEHEHLERVQFLRKEFLNKSPENK